MYYESYLRRNRETESLSSYCFILPVRVKIRLTVTCGIAGGNMQQALLDHLRIITEEEQRILDGVAEVDKDLYTSGKDFTVDSAKMLNEGKLIAVRTHTRFVHFPAHRHNFIEVLYVCQGQLTNIIGGK